MDGHPGRLVQHDEAAVPEEFSHPRKGAGVAFGLASNSVHSVNISIGWRCDMIAAGGRDSTLKQGVWQMGDFLCRICGKTDGETFTAREMMFGRRDLFAYWECRACGCVQIKEFPGNISDHYPSNYYSFRPDVTSESTEWILRSIKRLLVRNGTVRRAFLNSASTQRFLRSRPVTALYLKLLPDPGTRILDIGCGSGDLLRALDMLYYRNLLGVDPFLDRDIELRGRPLARKMELRDLKGQFDAISLHHVLEHMPDQFDALRHAKRLLAPGGMVIVRIPVAGTAAWTQYRQDWVQLDPPRHYFLHTDRSFRLTAEAAGLVVESIDYDSRGFQFWGSELYLRDIPLFGPDGQGTAIEPIFSAEELAAFESRAVALNAAQDGDQIVAILRAP
jgi:SAM-dependent methyltransferase